MPHPTAASRELVTFLQRQVYMLNEHLRDQPSDGGGGGGGGGRRAAGKEGREPDANLRSFNGEVSPRGPPNQHISLGAVLRAVAPLSKPHQSRVEQVPDGLEGPNP